MYHISCAPRTYSTTKICNPKNFKFSYTAYSYNNSWKNSRPDKYYLVTVPKKKTLPSSFVISNLNSHYFVALHYIQSRVVKLCLRINPRGLHLVLDPRDNYFTPLKNSHTKHIEQALTHFLSISRLFFEIACLHSFLVQYFLILYIPEIPDIEFYGWRLGR